MNADELLVLNYAGFRHHVADFYARLNESAAFRELFVRDPSGAMAQTIFPGYLRFQAGHINQANRLLFSLLSNPRFVEWAEEYQTQLEQQASEAFGDIEDAEERMKAFLVTLDRGAVYSHVSDAVPRFVDREMAHALFISEPGLGYAMPDPDGPVECKEPTVPGKDGYPFPKICAEPKPPAPGPGSVAVEIETFVYAVAVAAVAVVVTIVAVALESFSAGLSREDLRAVTEQLAERVHERAVDLRDRGRLIGLEAAMRGSAL
jgi:hypothetical protein